MLKFQLPNSNSVREIAPDTQTHKHTDKVTTEYPFFEGMPGYNNNNNDSLYCQPRAIVYMVHVTLYIVYIIQECSVRVYIVYIIKKCSEQVRRALMIQWV